MPDETFSPTRMERAALAKLLDEAIAQSEEQVLGAMVNYRRAVASHEALLVERQRLIPTLETEAKP